MEKLKAPQRGAAGEKIMPVFGECRKKVQKFKKT
jgi:hypothetical protein